jgi:hypothetical protein
MACGVVLSACFVTPAPASNVQQSALKWQAQNWWQRDQLARTDRGLSTTSAATDQLWVSCSMLRAPYPNASSSSTVYVDGDNRNGAFTVCSLTSYSYTGQFLGSAAFSNQATRYMGILSLSGAQLGVWAYTGMTCTIPPHGNGTLRGMTTVQ